MVLIYLNHSNCSLWFCQLALYSPRMACVSQRDQDVGFGAFELVLSRLKGNSS